MAESARTLFERTAIEREKGMSLNFWVPYYFTVSNERDDDFDMLELDAFCR